MPGKKNSDVAPLVEVFAALQYGVSGSIRHASAPARVNLQDSIEQLFQAISAPTFRKCWPYGFPNHAIQDHMFFYAGCGRGTSREVPLQSSAYVWEVADATCGRFVSHVLVHVEDGTVVSKYKGMIKVTFYCQQHAQLSIKNTFLEARYYYGDNFTHNTSSPLLDSELEFTCSSSSHNFVDSARAWQDADVVVPPPAVVHEPRVSCHSDVGRVERGSDGQSFLQAVHHGHDEFRMMQLSGFNSDFYRGREELVESFFYAILKGASTEVIRNMAKFLPNIDALRDHKGNGVMHSWARATRGGDALAKTGKLLINLGASVNVQRYDDKMSPLHHLAASYARRRNRREQHKVVLLCCFGAHVGAESSSGLTPLDLIQSQHQRDQFVNCCRAQRFSRCPVCSSKCCWFRM